MSLVSLSLEFSIIFLFSIYLELLELINSKISFKFFSFSIKEELLILSLVASLFSSNFLFFGFIILISNFSFNLTSEIFEIFSNFWPLFDAFSLSFESYNDKVFSSIKLFLSEFMLTKLFIFRFSSKSLELLITLLDEQQLSSNALLESLYVTGHSELKFKKNVNNYEITLKKNENKVDVRFQPEESTTHCTSNHLDEKGKYVVFNKAGLITIKCVAQNNTTNETYTIKVNKQKGTSLFLIVLIVIIIVLLLIYLVLRLLGYKIYFNFAMIGAFFRGIGDGIRRLFDK